jgi:Arc/MetJ-type ribon-helix-helix transcriptional regulator
MTEVVEKQRLNVAISKDVIGWIDENIENRRFASRSHALEYAVTVLRKIDAEQKTIRIIQRGTRLSDRERRAATFGEPGRPTKRWRF